MSVDHNRLYEWKKSEEIIQTKKIQEEDNIIRTSTISGGQGENAEAAAGLLEARERVSENRPPTIQELVSFRNLIEGKNYKYGENAETRKDAKRTTKQTGYMRNILNALGDLEDALSKHISTEKDAVEAVQNAFLSVVTACETYLEHRSGFFPDRGPRRARQESRWFRTFTIRS